MGTHTISVTQTLPAHTVAYSIVHRVPPLLYAHLSSQKFGHCLTPRCFGSTRFAIFCVFLPFVQQMKQFFRVLDPFMPLLCTFNSLEFLALVLLHLIAKLLFMRCGRHAAARTIAAGRW